MHTESIDGHLFRFSTFYIFRNDKFGGLFFVISIYIKAKFNFLVVDDNLYCNNKGGYSGYMFFVLINVFVVFERTVHALERIAMCKYLMHEVSECFRMVNSWHSFYTFPCMTAQLLHFHLQNEPFLTNKTTFA